MQFHGQMFFPFIKKNNICRHKFGTLLSLDIDYEVNKNNRKIIFSNINIIVPINIEDTLISYKPKINFCKDISIYNHISGKKISYTFNDDMENFAKDYIQEHKNIINDLFNNKTIDCNDLFKL